MKYDIIVVGAGHAGCEAANIAAMAGKKVALVTTNLKNIADLPCNPSIGGSAKGIVVREIDALGGIMGKIADQAILQIKMLNTKKGPGVRSLRAQVDYKVYQQRMFDYLTSVSNLDLVEGLVIDLIVGDKKVTGVKLKDGRILEASAVILTTGTYLDSKIYIGKKILNEGPHGEITDLRLSECLSDLGFELQRLKTGTPPRIEKNSINFDLVREEPGDTEYHTFAFNQKPSYNSKEQLPCYLTYTTEETKLIIEANLSLSSMYGGINEELGIGARYCPSIEDKVVRFNDKDRHQLFLEPETLSTNDIYIQGFSSSMPEDIQELMVKSIKGLENAVINQYAYAIEYDAINPLQLKSCLETKLVKNLFMAGQINGTSGYEEAAGQGLIAGINAVLKLKKKDPLVLKRDQAYIGVLIDDLVTKGTKEPYRLLTSRAEYRLLLRSDNADQRLTTISYKLGFQTKENYDLLKEKQTDIKELSDLLNEKYMYPSDNDYLTKIGSAKINEKITFSNLLKRPEINLQDLIEKFNLKSYNPLVVEQVSINIKYAGYIKKLFKEIDRMKDSEKISLKSIKDYNEISNLAGEAVEKLNAVKPANLAQASRISGVNPADISIIMVYLKRRK